MDEIIPCSSQVHNSIWAPSSPPSFHASASMVNFEDSPEAHNSQRQFVEQVDGKVETHDTEYDKHFHQPDKKKRLAPTQVQYLEKSFEVENKLEPDRKIHLAKELGLQPRQVAIWFQNRRARCKTKVLEKEYDSLKGRYDKLKADYETLFTENEKLKNEVHLLRKKLKPKTEPCDHHTIFDYQPKKNQISSQEDDDDDDALNVAHEVVYKQDDAASSAKSDVLDSDSPRYSSNVFDSDFSQDEDESLRTLLQLPKIEVECYDDLQPNSCNFGFPVQDQGTWVWKY